MENCFKDQEIVPSLPNKMLLDLDKEVEKIDSTRELSLLTAPLAENENFDSSPFMLNEEDELPWTDLIENGFTSMGDLNEGTELNQLEMIQHSEDPCISKENKPDPIIIINFKTNQNARNEECILNMPNPIWVIALDKSKDSLKQMEEPIKSNTSEILDEIEEWPEFIEWKKNQGLLESKEEDFNQNQTATPFVKPNQRKRNPAKIHKCHICSYQTNRKCNLNEHLLKHKKPEEAQMFKCDKCEFETIYRKSLKTHLLQQHKNWKELDHFQCGKCDFKTIYKHSLKTHLLQHKNPEAIDLYKCNQCKYETIHKSGLRKHVLQHKKPKEVSAFKCSQCGFKTTGRGYLQRHLRIHRDPKEI